MTNLLQSVFRPRPIFQFVGRIATRPATAHLARPAAIARLLFPALLFVMVAPSMLAQALPAAEAAPISTGFALPRTAGTLNYAVSASESLSWGYYGNQGAAAGTNLSGDLGYISSSKLYPFSAVFSGGHSWNTSGQPSYSFLNLAVSQVINVKRWNFLVSDSVSYLPGTPTTGLSGIAGVGDLGACPGQGCSDAGQGVLTDYSDRVVNSTSGSLQRQITGKTSLNGFGSYTIVRFLGTGGEGQDSDSTTGGGGISHQVNPRTSFGGNYSYSTYEFPGNSATMTGPGFESQTASGQITHQFTRKFTVTASAGPQWTAISSNGNSEGLSVYAAASAAYHGHFSQASVSYSRGTNSGYGVVGGALSQGGGVSVGRTFARVWNCSASASYTHSSGLPGANVAPFTFDTAVASVQTSRAIVRSISAYASYTLEHQSSNQATTAVDVFSGLEQVVGFGVTYSPSSIHLGRQ
ncbi:MAG: hypothetical protein ABSG84_01900 [Acidobacteriaceae bacterium]|jgi:hypothetical protein